MTIPFEVPAAFLNGLASGDLVRYGGILKEAGSGRIVGHLQETQVLQKAIQSGLSFDPTGVTGLIGVAQNVAISNKLDAVETTLGTLQSLQVATLACSVAGLGVTAASTAIILKRFTAIEARLETIEESLSDLPNKWREMALRQSLATVRTSVERLQEAELRPDTERVVQVEEDRLNTVYDQLHDGLCILVQQPKVDTDLLRSVLAGLALCGATQIRALIWCDMKEAAAFRSRRQSEKLETLAFHMPRHALAGRIDGGADVAAQISRECSEIRLRSAAQPDLARTLIRQDIRGPDFLERIQQEDKEPILILPTG